MRIVVAMDSFKGSLSSPQAGEAVREGIRRADPAAEVDVLPLADGGEGTVDALVSCMGGEIHRISVTGPLGDPVNCEYGVLPDEHTAVVEMCSAAGLTLVPENRRDPRYTTTFGVGEVIRDAIRLGCRKFLIGIGGSATNDGGAGMLQALGFELLDTEGKAIPGGAEGLKYLSQIRDENALPELRDCSFRIACDVTNPLCGPNGCSAVYGPQKGATPEMIPEMDGTLKAYAELAKRKYPEADADYPGAGAAGGMGFAFRTFLQAELTPGVKIVTEETRLEAYIREADYVVTGEGRLDGQTGSGKAPLGVARIAKKYEKPVIAFAGSVTEEVAALHSEGIDAFFPIVRGAVTLEEAMEPEHAKKNLAAAAEEVFRLISGRR